jgi:SAM-dependent methyltransferase
MEVWHYLNAGQEAEIKSRDDDAEHYDDWYLQKGYYHDWVEKKTIAGAMDLKKEDVVLDAGCGTGRFTRYIAGRCRRVYAVDFSPKSIDVLNKKARQDGLNNIETFVGDLTRPLPIEEQVDKIVSVQVIQHIPADSGRQTAMENLHRLLKAGGICVISLYNWRPVWSRGIIKEGEFSGGVHYFRFRPEEAVSLLERSGFKNVTVRGCVNFRYGFPRNFRLGRLLYPAAELDVYLSRFKFSCALGSFLVCRGFK